MKSVFSFVFLADKLLFFYYTRGVERSVANRERVVKSQWNKW
jgi:hypothetical protein